MTHATSVVPDLDKSKIIARAIQKRFDEMNSPIKLNHAYEALALAHNYPNWATMKGVRTAADPVADTARPFVVGHERSGDAYIELVIPQDAALNHVHCFATMDESRQSILIELGLYAIQERTSAIFVQPVSSVERKAACLNKIMSDATTASRRKDFFVLDLSSASSKVGNSLEILHSVKDADLCATLLLSGRRSMGHSDRKDSHRLVSMCAQTVLDQGSRLDAQAVVHELRKMHDERTGSKERPNDLALHLSRDIEAFAQKHRRFFDETSAWPGLESVFSRPQVLVVFVSDAPGELEFTLETIFYQALAAGLRTNCKLGAPDMLLLNEVSLAGFPDDFVEAATAARVCIVLADQCPTAPIQFNEHSLEFRSVFDPQSKCSSNYVIENGIEKFIWAGPRRNGDPQWERRSFSVV